MHLNQQLFFVNPSYHSSKYYNSKTSLRCSQPFVSGSFRRDGLLGLFAKEDSDEFHGELLGGSRPPFLKARQKSRKEQKPPNTPPFGMISILHFVKKQPKGLSSSCSCHADNRSPESDICCPCSVSDTQSSGPCRLSLSKLFRSSSFL